MGTITSSDNGTNVPGNDGFRPGGDFILLVANGTTINAVLQVKTSEGNWVDVPDDAGLSTINAAYNRPITAGWEQEFRIAVTTATGTWDWSFHLRRNN